MADTKTFQTQFRISSVWAGQPGVQKAQRALGGLQKTAKAATTHFRGMAKSVFAGMSAYGVASKAAAAFTDVLIKSVTAAEEAQEAHDELFTTVERMAKRYKSTAGKSVAEVSAIVEESTQALIKASEQMEQTGHDAETLQKGWAKLAATGALDPKQILEQRDAFSDVLSYIAGANATAEESAALGEAWADAILRGNVALLKQMDLTTGEIELVKNVTKLEKKGAISGEEAIKRRQALVLRFGKKFAGETERVFGRPSGKVAQMWTQVGNVLETLGEPFLARAPELAESFKKIAVEVKPIAEALGEIAEQSLKDFSGWLKEGGASTVVKNIKDLVEALGWIEDKLNAINKAFTFKESLWQWLQNVGKPGAQQKLPGSPSQQPNEALMEGESGRRMRAGIQAKAQLPSKSNPPYERESKAYEEATKAHKEALKKSAGTVKGMGGVLAGKEQAFIEAGARHGVDPDLLMAIARFETGGGTSNLAVNKKNIAGVTIPGTGEYRTFNTVEESIEEQAKIVARLQKKLGTTDIDALAKEYAEVGASNDPNKTNAEWPGAVKKNLAEIKQQRAASALQAKGVSAPGVKPALTSKLEKLQQRFGKLKIRSGYRDPACNAKVGGASDSEHTRGDAVDIDVSGLSLPERLALIDAASKEGIQGIGVYGNSLHFDLGEKHGRRAWGPSHRRGSVPPWAEKAIRQHESSSGQKVSMEDAMMHDPRRQGLNRLIKEINVQQRVGGATGGTNVAVSPTININGVAPGRESLMAKKATLALRDPISEGLRQLREMQAQDRRTNFA